MPRYIYKCRLCDESFMIVHGITEDQTSCEVCLESDCVYRIPQISSVKIVNTDTGKVVREYIEDAKKDLSDEKKRLNKEEYNPS